MERIDFDNVSVGDELVFATADNGFTGSGNFVDRSGIVTGKTDRTVTLRVVGNNPFADQVFRNGKARGLGRTARLRRTDWGRRAVRLARKGEQR